MTSAHKSPTGERTQWLIAQCQPSNDRQLHEGPPAPAVAAQAARVSYSSQAPTGGPSKARLAFAVSSPPTGAIDAYVARQRESEREISRALLSERYLVGCDLAAHSQEKCVALRIKPASTDDHSTVLEYIEQGVRR